MLPSEAFGYLRILIRAVSESDNIALIHEQLKIMLVVIDEASPEKTKRPRPN